MKWWLPTDQEPYFGLDRTKRIVRSYRRLPLHKRLGNRIKAAYRALRSTEHDYT